MWYVMQVLTNEEEKIKKQCDRQISDLMERCFVPYYEQKKRMGGRWEVERKILFPGYVFVITEQIQEVYQSLSKITGFTRLLGGEGQIYPLTEDETRFLEKFGGQEQVMKMSEGIIQDSRVIVTSGPLQGWEGLIKKINRHKRVAWLEVEMFGRRQQIQVGLEIVAKV